MAQQTASGLLREAMEQRGFYSGVDYNGREDPVWDPASGEWHGLQVSHGSAEGEGQATYLAIVRNTTGTSYCIRLGGGGFSPSSAVTGRLEVNTVVEPGQHQVLLAANVARGYNANIRIAFWRPDTSLPYNQQCRGVAPAGVVEWSAGGELGHFSGSRR